MNKTTKVIALCGFIVCWVFVGCGAAEESSENSAAAGAPTGSAGTKSTGPVGTGTAGTSATVPTMGTAPAMNGGGCSLRSGAVSHGTGELGGMALALALALAARRRRN